jgi:ribonuclease D
MTLVNADIQYIDSTEELESLCRELQKKQWLAIDTEFFREKTYKPQLCLIQVASDEHLAVIDPLALDNIDAFLDLIFDRSIIKVFHAATQDLEIFYWMRNEVPGPLFDTQIAAPLLGYNEQIGYGNLVKAALDVDLAKSHSRADWSRRPLPEVQLRYAADDVIYLTSLYLQMRDQLEARNRLQWLDNDFAALENCALYEKPASDMWMRVRGIQKFKNKALSGIQKLAEWRELTARKSDLPRNWLMKDDVIIDLARQAPDSMTELTHIRGLGDGLIKRHGEQLLQLLKSAQTETPTPLPPFAKKQKLNPQQEAIIDLLTSLVKIRSDELDINSAMLAPRKELEKLLLSPELSLLNKGWRGALIGEQLTDLLNGKIRMHIENLHVKLEPL